MAFRLPRVVGALLVAAWAGVAFGAWQPYPPGVGGPWGGEIRRLVSPGDPANPSDPAWNELWAATPGGVYRSADAGLNWEPRNTGLDSLDVTDVAVCRGAPNRGLAATPKGLYLTSDRGARWDRIAAGAFFVADAAGTPVASPQESFWRVAVDPADPNRLFAATFGPTHLLFRSEDGGGSWHALDPDAPPASAPPVPVSRFAFSSAGTLYAATQGGAVYRAARGQGLELVAGRVGDGSALVDLAVPGGGEVLAVAQGGAGLWISENGGATWSERHFRGGGNPDFLEVDVVAADPRRLLYHLTDPSPSGAAALDALVETQDLGASRRTLALPESRLGVETLVAGPGWDGFGSRMAGVFLRPPGAAAFELRSRGLAAFDVRDVAFAPDGSGVVAAVGGTAPPGEVGSGGVHLWSPATGWARRPLAAAEVLGSGTLLVRFRGDEVWAAAEGYGLFRSADGGATWEPGGAGLGATAADFLAGLAFSPGRPDVAVAGTSAGVYGTTTGGTTWQLAAGVPQTGGWRLAIAAGGTFLAAGLDGHDGRLFSSADGAAWAEPRPAAFAGLQLLALASSSRDPGRALVGTAGGGLWETVSAGASWRRVAGLPGNARVDAVAVADDGARSLAAAHVPGQGVFVSADGGTTWSAVTLGLVPSGGELPLVQALGFEPGGGRLVAAVRDRGLWCLDVAPADERPRGFVAVEGGSPTADSERVTVSLVHTGGPVAQEARYSNDRATWTAWEPFASARDWSLAPGPGTRAVHVQLRSPAGATSAVYADTVGVLPRALLSGAPVGPTSSTSATLTVGGEGVVAYRYRLDQAPFAPPVGVAEPIRLSALVPGAHRLEVVGIDAQGRTQREAASTAAVWSVEAAPATGGGGGATAAGSGGGGGGGCFLTSLRWR
ncbi:MAG: hypothetical protein ACYDA8_18555 [Deferrisomatales bacterium]